MREDDLESLRLLIGRYPDNALAILRQIRPDISILTKQKVVCLCCKKTGGPAGHGLRMTCYMARKRHNTLQNWIDYHAKPRAEEPIE